MKNIQYYKKIFFFISEKIQIELLKFLEYI